MKRKLFLLIVFIAMVAVFASYVYAQLSRLFPFPPLGSKLSVLTAIDYPRVEKR